MIDVERLVRAVVETVVFTLALALELLSVVVTGYSTDELRRRVG